MKIFFTIIFTVIFASIFVFIFQNNDVIVLKFLTFKTQVISGVMIFSSLFLGIVLTATFMFPSIAFRSHKIKELERENLKLKEKIKNETINFESDGLGSEGTVYKDKKE